jgi:hypothetical protein
MPRSGRSFSIPRRTSLYISCRHGLASGNPPQSLCGARACRCPPRRRRRPVLRRLGSSRYGAGCGSDRGCRRYPASSCASAPGRSGPGQTPTRQDRAPRPGHVGVDHRQEKVRILGIPAFGFEIDQCLDLLFHCFYHLPSLLACGLRHVFAASARACTNSIFYFHTCLHHPRSSAIIQARLE